MKVRAAPRVCVWEITLACNAACVHCGSDAGLPRAHELDTDEALSLCDALSDLGVEEVTLSGGEPLLRSDWPMLAKRLTEHGVRVDLISNGIGIDDAAVARVIESGITNVTVSIDGPAAIHDEVRGTAGGLSRTLGGVRALRARRIPVGAVTQVSKLNIDHLRDIENLLVEAGVAGWQVQLTMPLGRCADRPDIALDPTAVPHVIDFVVGVSERGRIRAYGADNLGWMTSCEPLLRSANRPTDRVYLGCHAGLSVMGVTSDGTVRGCLSMPSFFDEGNVRERPLADIWRDPGGFAYNREFDAGTLTGACKGCAFGKICRAGCKALAYADAGLLSENRYCARIESKAEER